jgi:hypothetical protein
VVEHPDLFHRRVRGRIDPDFEETQRADMSDGGQQPGGDADKDPELSQVGCILEYDVRLVRPPVTVEQKKHPYPRTNVFASEIRVDECISDPARLIRTTQEKVTV